MVDGQDGHRAILDAMDYFKLVRGERVRFAALVQVLWDDGPDLGFKRDVLLFLNTVSGWTGWEYRVCMSV